ncbi:MAG: diguanylate cyclase [Pseudomonadota bacterium]
MPQKPASSSTSDSILDHRVWNAQIERGFRWLRFEAPLEHHYRQYHLRSVRRRVLICVISMIVFSVWMTANNNAAEPETVDTALTLMDQLSKYVQRPISALLLITLLVRPLYFRYWLQVAPLVLASSGVFGGYSVAESVTQGNLHAFVTMLTGFLGLYMLVGFLFWNVAAVGAIITLSYGFSLSYHGAPPELIRFETSVLMVVSVVALVFAYTLEHSQRLSFLQRRIMQVLSSVDSLTGLKNRRVFDEELESLWKQGHRDSNPLGLLLVDVDHFKAFNDRYGHQAGDRCLARIGEVLGDSVRRPLDIAARVGGEEFALLFYAATPEHVVAAGKQIEEEIRALEIPHADSSTAPVVTVSIGAGLIQPRPNRSPESLVKQVDLALYQAKSQGRGRLTWFESDHQLGDEVVAAVRSS